MRHEVGDIAVGGLEELPRWVEQEARGIQKWEAWYSNFKNKC